MKLKRTHRCGELGLDAVGQPVVVSGWVNNWREHAGPFFIDLRDRYGVIQLVFSPTDEALYEKPENCGLKVLSPFPVPFRRAPKML